MQDLNDQQRQAVQADDGPLLIIAGPGTGKTKTLAARVTYLIETARATPAEILALTFTTKAAQEMRQRVSHSGPAICTFHALCNSLLGGEQTFVTEPDRLAIIASLPRPANLKGLSTRDVALLLSRYKNMAEDSPQVASMVHTYDSALRDKYVCDFDDLLLQARDLLRVEPATRPHYRYILVDEFQDTNRLQYDLLHLLRSNDNLFVIGDPNQSIYAFRGASGTIFEQFKADFPQAKAVTLTRNYRSAPEIVALSNGVFADAPQLQANSAEPGTVRAVEVLNEYSEANWVVGEIQRALGGADMLQASTDDVRGGLRDFAVLYRSRKAAMVVQKCLADSGLPYQVVGEGSPYARPDIQQLIAMLRATLELNPAAIAPADSAGHLADQAGLDSKEVHQFISTLVRFGTLAEALEHLDAIADQQFYDPDAEAITLLTIHAAKGLEFSRVFVVGAEEGLLPYAKADESEERRLFYVAVTRAKEQLDILHATKRRGESAKVSRFIAELPAAVLPRLQDPNLTGDKRRAQKRHAKRAQATLF